MNRRSLTRACGCLVALAVAKAHAANWYVDPAAAGSSLNTGTNWDNAWTNLTAVDWNRIDNGDTLFLSGGETSRLYYGQWNIPSVWKKATNEASRIYVRVGQDPGHEGLVVFDGQNRTTNGIWLTGNRSWTTFSGRGPRGSANWHFVNYVITDLVSSVQGGAIASANPNTGITIEYLVVSNANNGITLNGAQSCIVRHCRVEGVRGDHAIGLGASQGLYDANLVHDNAIGLYADPARSWYGPDGIQGANGVSAYRNRISGQPGWIMGQQHQDAFQISGSYVKIFNNDVVNSGHSMIYVDPGAVTPTVWSDYQVFNNVCRITNGEYYRTWCRGVGFVPWSRCLVVSNFYVVNNTFVDLPKLSAVEFWPFNAAVVFTNIYIMNNLMLNCGVPKWNPVIWCKTNSAAGYGQAGFVVDYNLLCRGTRGDDQIVIDGQPLAQAHPRSGQPSFVRYAETNALNDLHLAIFDTAARSQGANLSHWFRFDADDKPRPATGPWDIGAYQTGAETAMPAPPVIAAVEPRKP